ncbi:MAG: hypothetical protein JWO47_1094 [Candidatus Saccharibacteria bacterium]|nr:hypothetical protein [Candidatus Saccharibacteria bacterium]
MDEVVHMAEALRHKARDYCDKPHDPHAVEFIRELDEFYELAHRGMTADKLEWKVKDLRKAIEELKHTEGLYDFDHIDDMHDRCEDMRKIIEKLARQ